MFICFNCPVTCAPKGTIQQPTAYDKLHTQPVLNAYNPTSSQTPESDATSCNPCQNPCHKHKCRNRGHWGHMPPRLCNKQRSALFTLKNGPFFLRKKCPQSVGAPKIEMLATSLVTNLAKADLKTEYPLLWVLYNFLISFILGHMVYRNFV